MSDLATPHRLTSVFQQSITIGALCVAAASIYFAARSTNDERNARLVEIGVRVLMVDPSKNAQVKGARQWALDLIDKNAGVTFSPEARSQLLDKALDVGTASFTYTSDDYVTYAPDRPPPKSKK